MASRAGVSRPEDTSLPKIGVLYAGSVDHLVFRLCLQEYFFTFLLI